MDSINDKIVIKGARQHNLKNIDLEIPKKKLVVITGVSGSGKSTLAFDTIYAEGQRRYVESLSSYARQFLGRMDKPDVDYIEGLSPAISIDQKGASRNPRSTAGTVTEIYDYYRLLFARAGIPHCYKCGREISSMTVVQMAETIKTAFKQGTRFMLLAPIVKNRRGEFEKIIAGIFSKGYTRVRIDGKIYESDDEIHIEKNKRHNIETVIDRLVVSDSSMQRLMTSLETSLSEGSGLTIAASDESELLFSEHSSCPKCDVSLPEIEPSYFSFNSPLGCCPVCSGIGSSMEIDEELVVPDPSLSIMQGAVAPWGEYTETTSRYQTKGNIFWGRFSSFASAHGISMTEPFEELSQEHQHLLLYGNGGKTIYTDNPDSFEGCIPHLKRRYEESDSDYIREFAEKFMINKICPACMGRRLRPEVLAVTVADRSIAEFTEMTVEESIHFFENILLTEKQTAISGQILKEIKTRLGFLHNVGLDYLSLNRAAYTLSGGEAQRIRLATQIGSGLTGVLYVLDEPSIGLHQRDNEKLIATMKSLRDLGNTVIVVEHDEETMAAADYIVDVGIGAGSSGGEIVAVGTAEDIKKSTDSVTGKYLSGRLEISVPDKRRIPNGKFISISGASENNLKNIDVDIPLGVFVCVTGVSGSGKSTLVNEILYKTAARKINRASERAGKCREIAGLENIDKVIVIDQSPIGRTPRSNPATYTGAFTAIREIFAQTRDAKMYGYKPGRFSFNIKGGRCESCFGDGIIKIEMHFLPDVYVVCEECKGKRYSSQTLDVKFKGKNISDVLEMTVDEAVELFENFQGLKRKLECLSEVGLGYIKMGQSSTTLSGGEAQRVKLAAELSKRPTGRTLYILDEPTTGLHFEDISRLLYVLGKLADSGNTVLLIEHNMDVIKCADYIIDLGPEGGSGGGRVVACGPPELIVRNKNSYTGKFLKKYIAKPVYSK